ncbi:hypothetical protein MFLO_02363 [Listeria floridensis FSL S10-1187]|uniref:Phage holin n=1 Tax=Listeria floridensis FSL S10-1187 TaxID=1265817 RepID=A0ABP3B1R9_9LIST|nr:phage holin [Listeria floridensis]EUJ33509.1 hypothetical protein MFLO_02363 [Listeria floridensis FSL S10-1187]
MKNWNNWGEVMARSLFLLVALVNQVLALFNLSPLDFVFSEEELAGALSLLLTAAASVWAWWKNNSFTKAAKKADQVLQDEKRKGVV